MFKTLKDAAKLAKDLAVAVRHDVEGKTEAAKTAIATVTDATGLTATRAPKLIFAMDATASRSASWAMAMELQSEMLAMAGSEGLTVAIGYFNNSHCGVTPYYFPNAALATTYMRTIQMLSCYTKIAQLLQAFESHARNPLGARVAIFVGDAFEDDVNAALAEAAKLKGLGFRVFMLLEGSNSSAERSFKAVAEATGGVFARFDAGAKAQLRELMQSIAAYTAGTLSIANQGAFAEALKALPPPVRK